MRQLHSDRGEDPAELGSSLRPGCSQDSLCSLNELAPRCWGALSIMRRMVFAGVLICGGIHVGGSTALNVTFLV